MVFDINPPFADVHAVIGKYRYLYDHGVRTAALVYLDVDAGEVAESNSNGRRWRRSASRS